MKSDLNAAGFQKKLQKNTNRRSLLGKMSYRDLFNSLKESDKVFAGEFSDENFSLTKNKILFPTIYKIEGTYAEINENECAVAYAIKPIRLLKFIYVCALIINTLGVAFFSFVLLTLKEDAVTSIIILLLLTAFMLVLPVLIQKYHKRSMEKMFREVFKIRD